MVKKLCLCYLSQPWTGWSEYGSRKDRKKKNITQGVVSWRVCLKNKNQTADPLREWRWWRCSKNRQTDTVNISTPFALTGGAGGVGGVNGLRRAAQQPLMISPLFRRTEKSHYLPPHYPAIPHMVDGSSLPWAPCSSHGWQCSPLYCLHLNPPPPQTLLFPLKPPALYITFNTLTLTVYNVSILQNHSASSRIAEPSVRKINTTLSQWQ